MTPDIHFIDLDQEETDNTQPADLDGSLAEDSPKGPSRRKLPPFLNWHILFFAAVVVIILFIVFRFLNWGTFVNPDEHFGEDFVPEAETLDLILPPPNGRSNDTNGDGVVNMLVFGNAPFADDRDSKDSLANMIAEQTGANVYNCAISDSYLATVNNFYSGVDPCDAYSLYWLVILAATKVNDGYFLDAGNTLGEEAPAEAEEVWKFLYDLDMNTIDVVTIMYDAMDYLMGRPVYNDQNDTDIQRFTGNLEASIEVLQSAYPHIRIIVMSPTYAFALDENGEYMSSDMKAYDPKGQYVLSTYVIKEADSCSAWGVSFIDNLYGTVNEDNARDYLTDNLHLNTAGRKAVAERFTKAYLRYIED